MSRIEIKLDKTTLPQSKQWCVWDNQKQHSIVGIYEPDEEGFYPINANPVVMDSAFNVNFWQPLEIKWEWVEWSEKKESLAIVEGSDNYGNNFEACGVMNGRDEVLEVSDIELTGGVNTRQT